MTAMNFSLLQNVKHLPEVHESTHMVTTVTLQKTYFSEDKICQTKDICHQ